MTGLGESLPQTPRTILQRSLVTWAALVALVLLTLLLAYLPFGQWNTLVSLGIAATKALVIAWSFMNLRRPDPLLRLAGGASLLWIAFMFTLTFADLASRSEPSQAGTVAPRGASSRGNEVPRLF